MKPMHHPSILATLAAAAITALVPTLAAAQAAPADPVAGTWRYSASVYGYLPSLGGTTSAPVDSGGTPIEVDVAKIVDSLKFTFMGALDVHNGQWGVFTDLIYLNLGGDKQQSRDFTVGGLPLPAGITADLGWDLKGWVWTLAGEYRVAADPSFLTLDVLAGARLFDLSQELRWNISGTVGEAPGAGRSGKLEAGGNFWDGIVGVKGRFALDRDGHWTAPFYADVGTGDSDLTWQLAAGVSYRYGWCDLNVMWRYLAYEFKSGSALQNVNFNGPMIGATFRW